MKIKQWIAFAMLAALLVGCTARESVSVSESVPDPSAPAQASAPEEPVSQSEPQPLYDGGQEDPTLRGFPQAKWEHIEYKNFGSPDSWETYTQEAYHLENGVESGLLLTFAFKLPERVSLDSSFAYDGDFARGNIKLGEGFNHFVTLLPGETAVDNTYKQYSKEGFAASPSFDETTENVLGGYCSGSRGDVSFARYVTQGASGYNNTLTYVVQLGDRWLTSASFYVSENATADDLQLYDEIVLSAQALDSATPDVNYATDAVLHRDILVNYGADITTGIGGIPLETHNGASLFTRENWDSEHPMEGFGYFGWNFGQMWNEGITIEERQTKYAHPSGKDDMGYFFPQALYEERAQQYFDVSVDELRSITEYDAAYEGYNMQAGFGMGGTVQIELRRVEQREDLLELYITLVHEGAVPVQNENKILRVRMAADGSYKYIGYATE